MFSTQLNKKIPTADFVEEIKSKIRSGDVHSVRELVNQGKMNYFGFNFVDPKSKYTLLHFNHKIKPT